MSNLYSAIITKVSNSIFRVFVIKPHYTNHAYYKHGMVRKQQPTTEGETELLVYKVQCTSRSPIQTQENKKANTNVKNLTVYTWCHKPNHTSKTAKIILKLIVCVFLNIGLLLKTVILNYSTIWLLTPTLSKINIP